MSYSPPYLRTEDKFSWQEETTYKTRPTNIDRFINVDNVKPPWPVRDPKVTHAVGAGRSPLYIQGKRKQTLEGSFSAELQTGEFIGAVMGICVTTGTDPYTHTIDKALLLSWATQFGWEMSTNNLITEFLGCLVNKATFKAGEDNEELKMDIDYWATIAQDGGSSFETVSTSALAPYVFKEGVFSSTALYGGAKAAVFGFELVVNNNLKRSHAGGSFQPYNIVAGRQDYELRLNAGVLDDAEWDEIIDTDPDKEYDFSYLLTRGANDTIKFSGTAKFKEGPPDVESADIRIDEVLIPDSVTIEIVDSIETYPFE